MEFRLEFEPMSFTSKISLADKILLMGSCFTEHMFEKLTDFKFTSFQNPHGILFNPASICASLNSYINNTHIKESELFFQNSLWNHWSFHSSRSRTELKETLAIMNSDINTGTQFLKDSNWLIITFGSAFVYEKNNHEIVANCHKAPASTFTKRMLGVDEIVLMYADLLRKIAVYNPSLKIIFTVSPVRHLREGFIENNRSKSALFLSIDKLIGVFNNCFYFPSYELIIDDLRDYRFYAEDMVHPNYLATNYVWNKFSLACIDGKSREIFKELDQLKNAMKHRPIHPDSEEHQKFREKFRSMILNLTDRFPDIDFQNERTFFEEIDGYN